MKKALKLVIITLSLLFTILCCIFQYYHYSKIRKIDISKASVSKEIEYSIEEINYKDTDNDYIIGTLSMDGHSTTSFPTKIVFYQDDSNEAYSLPVKLSNINEDGEVVDGANNNGLYAASTHFDVLIDRYSGLRNKYKIGFLIKVDGKEIFVKTDNLYKYSDV
ncbi:hypothetical protein SAMN02745247_02793 [Butyrivibrio hungatei DSM 14810]|uniref:Uncharacterized protein n=1 Tax=Butyrivibrio hungatei DSM 14810 TaxID=1121132 RepID=A0A1M7T128_9FIRM|nr:hypothetical protein [Butyrivibrio hungatei]SHN64341.1 hypothetical protein SAMN02745247_02793 [Butyrivibrio hungatei DSM 14810]